MKITRVAFFGLVTLLVAESRAREYPDLFPTSRGLALGGAVTASIDDEGAVSYDPAGLALVPEAFFRAPDLLRATYSPGVLEVINRIKSQGSGGTDDLVKQLKDFDGTGVSAGLDALGLAWVRPRMALQFQLLNFRSSFRVRTPSLFFAKINTRMTADMGLSAGYAQPFFENKLRIGAVFRPVLIRAGVEKQFENENITDITSLIQDMGAGYGIDLDLGAQGEAPSFLVFGFKMKPMAGLALQNIFANQYRQPVLSRLANTPPPLERRLNAGVALRLEDLGAAQVTFSAEARDLLVDTDSWLEHAHFGFEFVVKSRSWLKSILRAHFAKGNLGGGIAGRLWFGELEFGSYAVNLGRGPGVGVDRRNYVSLAARF